MSGGHGSKNWEEMIIPGRQDNSERKFNPVIRSADLSVAPLIFYSEIDQELRVARQKVGRVEMPHSDTHRFL